jgi:hypothetical protein
MTELRNAFLHDSLELVAVAHVALASQDTPIVGFDHASGLGKILFTGQWVPHRFDRFTDVERDDIGTLLGQSHGVASALPPTGASDKRDLACDTVSHCPSSG